MLNLEHQCGLTSIEGNVLQHYKTGVTWILRREETGKRGVVATYVGIAVHGGTRLASNTISIILYIITRTMLHNTFEHGAHQSGALTAANPRIHYNGLVYHQPFANHHTFAELGFHHATLGTEAIVERYQLQGCYS